MTSNVLQISSVFSHPGKDEFREQSVADARVLITKSHCVPVLLFKLYRYISPSNSNELEVPDAIFDAVIPDMTAEYVPIASDEELSMARFREPDGNEGVTFP